MQFYCITSKIKLVWYLPTSIQVPDMSRHVGNAYFKGKNNPNHCMPASLIPFLFEDNFSTWHMDILSLLPNIKYCYQDVLLVVDSFSIMHKCFLRKTKMILKLQNKNTMKYWFGTQMSIVTEKLGFCPKKIYKVFYYMTMNFLFF